MKFTNNYNLPQYLVDILSKDYRLKENRISVTQLIDEPLVRNLKIKYYDELVIDVSDRLPFIKGNALHQYLEGHAEDDEFAEVKQEDIVGKWTIVGKADNYIEKSKTIIDYKRAKVWAWIYRNEPDSQISKYEKQINIYCWQWRRRGFEVEKLFLDIFWDDFSKVQALHKKDYPKIAFTRLPVKIWTFEKQEKYIKERLEIFDKYPFRECSPSSKWQKDSKYAVMVVGRKSALPGGVCDSLAKAKKVMADYSKKGKKDLYIEEREGENTRCKHYCEVAQKCLFVKRNKK